MGDSATHPPFLIGRLRPDLLDIQLTEEAKNLVEAAGDLRVASSQAQRQPGNLDVSFAVGFHTLRIRLFPASAM
jgi:hypothetical protein